MEVASTVIAIRERTDVAEARRRAAERAASLGFDEQVTGRLAIIVTEMATNQIKHAGSGEIIVGPAAGRGGYGVQVLALDKGRGISNLETSLRDGYSTTGTSGTGLGAITRAATSFAVWSEPGRGTVLAATIFPQGLEPLGLAAVSVPMPGEQECGDGWAAWSAGELTSIMVCDGLGHGRHAADATAVALAAFRRHAERSLADVLAAVHDALRSTRGAAVAIAELDHRHGILRYGGIGNIRASVAGAGGNAQHLVSVSGIAGAGHVMRRVQPFTYPWSAGHVLVMHSDGIGTQWSLGRADGLASQRGDAIAGTILRDYRRERDDATVVVYRHREAA